MTKKKISKIFLVFALILAFWVVFFLGYARGHQDLILEKGYIPRIINKDLGQPKDVDFSLFWEVWNKVLEKYPNKINPTKMLSGAIQGMLYGLGDKYAGFMESSETKAFLQDLEGTFEGIGVEISIKNNQLTVVAPLEGSPAAKAGLKPGDVIVKIDGENTDLMNIDEAIVKIRGQSGTKVTLTINREGINEEFSVTIMREKIVVESVKLEIKNDRAIIKITQFGSDTINLLNSAADKINQRGINRIILDLRNNPGGYLDTAVDVASFFIKSGVIVIEEGKAGQKEEFKAKGDAKLAEKKLVVLINEGSASGSEIVAGAIQDYKAGILIGEKTFGKGSVQELIDLKGGASLRLTVAKWLTPKGRQINDQGITPDIVVPMTDADTQAGRDPQMERALTEVSK